MRAIGELAPAYTNRRLVHVLNVLEDILSRCFSPLTSVIFILRRLGINRLIWYRGQEGFDNKLFMDKGHISEVDDVIFALNSISREGGIFYDGAFKRTHPTVEAAGSLYTEIMQDTLLGAGWSHLPALEIVEKLRSAFSSTYRAT